MKIAVSAQGSNLQSPVGHRLGTSSYLIFIDTQTMSFEAVPNPAVADQRASGLQAVVLAISRQVDAVLTGYCSPTAMRYLSDYGIKVVTGISGTIGEAAGEYRRQLSTAPLMNVAKSATDTPEKSTAAFPDAFKKSARQIADMLPILIGVVLLVGLFNTFIAKEFLSAVFSGNNLLDILLGTGFGSILTGNPVNSYVIGGQLLKYGVSLMAVTGFIAAWVTVGLVQLPAEIAALGKKFALARNAISFFLCLVIAVLTVVFLNLLTG
jgi:predicted Fe-Mo cluster-binding NifX family protein